jgi:hypothetical protein
MLVLIFAFVVMNFLTTHTTVVAENFLLSQTVRPLSWIVADQAGGS